MSVELKARPLCAGVSVTRTMRLLLSEVDDGVGVALSARFPLIYPSIDAVSAELGCKR